MAREKLTKAEMLTAIAESTGIAKADVKAVIEGLGTVIGDELQHAGEAVVPGIAKLVVRRRSARPSRLGINPFTGIEQKFKAQPAKNQIKARPLKALKDLV